MRNRADKCKLEASDRRFCLNDRPLAAGQYKGKRNLMNSPGQSLAPSQVTSVLSVCRGLQLFELPSEPNTYHYLPTRPDLRRDALGQPLTSIIDAGTKGYLMLSVAWEAERKAFEALHQKFVAQNSQLRPADIRLVFAPVSSVRCRVLLADDCGGFQALASSNTSRVPPYDAVFSLELQGEQLAKARAALLGEPGNLAIEYCAELGMPVKGTATFAARSADLAPWLAEADANDVLALLEEAVQHKAARVTVNVPDQHTSHLTVPLYERLLQRTAEQMRRWLTETIPDHINVTVRLDERVSESVCAFADVGELVSHDTVRAAAGGPDAAS